MKSRDGGGDAFLSYLPLSELLRRYYSKAPVVLLFKCMLTIHSDLVIVNMIKLNCYMLFIQTLGRNVGHDERKYTVDIGSQNK